MRWRPSLPLPVPVPPYAQPAPSNLRHVETLPSAVPANAPAPNAYNILSLAFDEARGLVVSGGMDGHICTYPASPAPPTAAPHRLELQQSGSLVIALDFVPSRNILLSILMPRGQGINTPSIGGFSSVSGASPWASLGYITGQGVRAYTVARALADARFAVAEVTHENPKGSRLLLFDIGSAPSFGELRASTAWPVDSVVTSMVATRGSPDVFVTGTQNKTLLLWDRRLPKAAAVIGVADPASGGASSPTPRSSALWTSGMGWSSPGAWTGP